MASDGTIKISTELDNTQSQKAMSKFGKIVKVGLKGITASVLGTKGALAIATTYAIKTGIQFESSFAGVKKTVDATDQEIQVLRDGIRGMSKEIPQTASGIAGVTEAAGQLGIKNKNLLDFTRVMSDLGVATNMSSTQAATSLARLANITQMPQEKFSNLGSTVVYLGNKLATTESEITEMGLRLAGAGKQVGMSEAEILGLAGALSSVGIEADAGGSAVSTVLSKMQLAVENGGAALEQFADVAGMSAGEFKEAFEKDAAQALVAFVKGLGTMDERGKSAIGTLADMEITEIRQRDALLRLSGAGDLLNQSLGYATKAWDENNALTNEAEQRYQTLESRFQILKNGVDDFGVSIYDSLRDPLKNTVNESIAYVERLHGAFKSGGLKSVVRELGEVFDDVTDDIAGTSDVAAGIVIPLKEIAVTGADLSKTVLPVASEGVKFLAKNMNTLLPVTAAAVIGFKAYNVIGKATATSTKANAAATKLLTNMEKKNALQLVATNGGLTVRQAIMAVYNGQITATTALTGLWARAQNMLNQALSTNPIGVVVTAMVALYGIEKAIEASVTKQTEAEREHSKALRESAKASEESVQKAKERKQSYEELVQSQNEQAAGDIAQLDRLQKLNEELNTIVDANGNVKAGEEDRAAFITSQLSSALGIEISMTDNQIANYDELKGKIAELIQQKRIDAVMSAQQAKYEEAVANQMKVAAEASANLTALKKASAEVTREKAELDSLEADRTQAVIDGDKRLVKILDEKIKKQEKDVESAEKALNNSQKAYEENTNLLKQYANDIDMYTAVAEAAASGNAEAIESAITQITSGIKTASNATTEELQKQVVEVSKTEDLIRKSVEEKTPGFTQAMLDQASQATTAALEEFAKAAPQTKEEIGKVPNEALAALIAGDMKGKLSSEASGSVQGMLDAMSGMNEETRNAVLALLEPMLTESELASVKMKLNGQNAGKEFAGGVKSKTGESSNAGKVNADAADKGAASKNLTQTGAKSGGQYASGVGSKTGDANKKGKELADNASSGASSKDGYTPGSDFASGFANGIASGIGKVAKKAAELAKSAYDSLRKKLDEHSPSRKTKKSGKNFDLGLGIGIEDNEDVPVKAVENMSENVLSALDSEALSKKMKNIDIPETMARVYMAVDDKQARVAENMITSVSAKENIAWRAREKEQIVHLSDGDIQKLAKELAREFSSDISKEMEGMGFYAKEREIFRMMREVQQ